MCEGWTNRDLAAHLYVRERQPWFAAGMFIEALSGKLDAAMNAQSRRDYATVVREWAAGPPALLKPFDARINTLEHFIHHEDVRRGGVEDFSVREFAREDEEALREALKGIARMMLKKSTVPVIIEPRGLQRFTAKEIRGVSEDGSRVAHIRGPIGEIAMYLYGRVHRDVEVLGAVDGLRISSL